MQRVGYRPTDPGIRIGNENVTDADEMFYLSVGQPVSGITSAGVKQSTGHLVANNESAVMQRLQTHRYGHLHDKERGTRLALCTQSSIPEKEVLRMDNAAVPIFSSPAAMLQHTSSYSVD